MLFCCIEINSILSTLDDLTDDNSSIFKKPLPKPKNTGNIRRQQQTSHAEDSEYTSAFSAPIVLIGSITTPFNCQL